ncbi:MAG: undecaprenyl-phosphate glucose phosphotransferase [Alphaproteobacteria bacterium]|nr:undecaprenyl-phosphate glucose phosphotransferase [Alphaproteobacteria bacterium]MDE2496161.1 undecaprenyl-phosphate glucose phosphotransferase [Alphaproteobacteria bacterium]
MQSKNVLYRLLCAFQQYEYGHTVIRSQPRLKAPNSVLAQQARLYPHRAESEQMMLDDRPDRGHDAVQWQKYIRFGPLALLSNRSDGSESDVSSLWEYPFQQWFRNRATDDGDARRHGAAGILNEQAYAPTALFCDAAVIILTSLVTGVTYHLAAFTGAGEISLYFGTGVLVAVFFCGFSRAKAQRLPFGTSFAYERARTALSSWLAAFALFLFFAFTLKIASHLSRGALLSFFMLGATAAVISRVNAPILMARVLRRGTLDAQDIIIIGPQSDPLLLRVAADLRRTVRVAPCMVMFDGTCDDSSWPTEVKRVLCHVYKLAHRAGPGEILVASASLTSKRLSGLLEGLAQIPRAVCLVPDGLTASSLRQKITAIGDHIAVEVQQAPLGTTQRAVKRVIDVLLSIAALLFLAPLLITIVIAIKSDSRGPVLFHQKRTGYRGRVFQIFKFRTMTVLEDGPVLEQACRNDRRVTRVGNFLRRTSLDELPQLFNVLLGDMSLVGPRPHAVAHDDLYERHIPNYALRQHVMPGITGWAQVNGLRGETVTIDVMRHRVEHDVWYVTHGSLFLDLQIMARTFVEVLLQRNAY